ncbi:hypothetical protein BCR36DRAFT_584178 [Piromyces finnis]|uniref:C2 domain-containing protein n=1 Tax=Piromyces finnis TaxID=1754191 RepID=A0A1Y1V8M9_9FUNG|nr:hypothetical protein BCR36DRAFT_584178 [Piromyces finnis]|eukprot:ORX48619.1 hypothetical protein BCR36DRAFT_584178 [Piromyces finnis]
MASRNKLTILVTCIEGRYFSRENKKKIYLQCRFNNEILTTDPVDYTDEPIWDTELTWDLESKVLHFLKSQRVALKLICFSLYRKERKNIGYIMLDLRSASGFPPKERWYPLLNSKVNGSNRPEIKIAFGIGNMDTLNSSSLNYSPPIKLINKSTENISKIDISNVENIQEIPTYKDNKNNNSINNSIINNNNNNTNSLEPILTNDGFYKIGNGEDYFILIISLIATYNLNKLVSSVPNQIDSKGSSNYNFCYSILGNEITTEEFDNINKPSFSIERVSIRFRSTKQDMIEFFNQLSSIKILLNKGTQTIAYSDIDLHQLWKEDKSDFNPIFRKSIPLYKVDSDNKTIISNEIQPQVMILMCLQPENNNIDEIMKEVDRIIESNDVMEADSFLIKNNIDYSNNINTYNDNYNPLNLENNHLLNDHDDDNYPINENNNKANNDEQLYINENINYDKNNEIINDNDNSNKIQYNDVVKNDNNEMYCGNIIVNDNDSNNHKGLNDNNDNNNNIINMEYNELISPNINVINENVIDELSFNIESIKNTELDDGNQHQNLTMEEEIIIRDDVLNSNNNVIESTKDVVMLNNKDENINITNSNLKIEYNSQDEYNSNSFIPLDSTNFNLDNTENIQTDFIIGEGNTELLIKNVATSINNQNTEKEITLPEEFIEEMPQEINQNSNDKFTSKLPISMSSNLKKSISLANVPNNEVKTINGNNISNSTPILNKTNSVKRVNPNIQSTQNEIRKTENKTLNKSNNSSKNIINATNINSINRNKSSNINIKVTEKQKFSNNIKNNNIKITNYNIKQESLPQTETMETTNIFQTINLHQYKFTINLQSIRNIKLNAHNVYCKYLYLPFGNKLPQITYPPVDIVNDNEIYLSCSSYSYEFFMDRLVLSNSLESIPLEVELWQKNDQLNKEIKLGQSTIFMNEILNMPEISKNNKNKQDYKIQQWSTYVPIFSIENIGVPFEKIADLKIILQIEDFGLVEDKPSPPIQQNSSFLNQATPTPNNHSALNKPNCTQPLINNNNDINYTQTPQYKNQCYPESLKKNSNPYSIPTINPTYEEKEEENEISSSYDDQLSNSSISIHETNEYKVAIELELWKQNEQQKFKNELKKKEQELVNQLSKEWNKRNQERNSVFNKKVKELKDLEDKVKKLVNDLENREQNLMNDEEELRRRRDNLEREFRLKNSTIEDYEKCIREECRCNVEVATRKAEAADKKYKEINKELEREHQKYNKLSEEYELYKSKMKESTETKLTQELNQLQLDNEKLNKQLLALKKTKKYYKTEWIITLKELSKTKQILQEKVIKERENEKEKEFKRKIEQVNESIAHTYKTSPNRHQEKMNGFYSTSNDDEIPIKLNDEEKMKNVNDKQQSYPNTTNSVMNPLMNSVLNSYNNNSMGNSNPNPNQWNINNTPPTDNVTQNLLNLITQVLLNNNNNNSKDMENKDNKDSNNNENNKDNNSKDKNDDSNNNDKKENSTDEENKKEIIKEEKESQKANIHEKIINEEYNENMMEPTIFDIKNLKRKINDKGVYIWGVSFNDKPKEWISFTKQPNLYMIPYHLMNHKLIPEINRLIDERDDLLNTEIYSENDDLIYGLNNRIYELVK